MVAALATAAAAIPVLSSAPVVGLALRVVLNVVLMTASGVFCGPALCRPLTKASKRTSADRHGWQNFFDQLVRMTSCWVARVIAT
jgi:hypothetical protein